MLDKSVLTPRLGFASALSNIREALSRCLSGCSGMGTDGAIKFDQNGDDFEGEALHLKAIAKPAHSLIACGENLIINDWEDKAAICSFGTVPSAVDSVAQATDLRDP